MTEDEVVVVAACRTPMGAFRGELAGHTAPQLGAAAIAEAVRRAGLAADEVDEVLMGNVLAAGVGQAPARQAALGAGLADSTPCTTISKVCGSGMRAVMLGHDAIRAGSAGIVVAGGMESMSNAPYLLGKARGGYRLGHGTLQDHMFLDGLEDAYEKGRLMGSFAEDTAREYQFTRVAQDGFALRSLERARAADFSAETVPVGDCATDEQPRVARPERIPTLKPAFRPDGTITAANASSISDGAAALVLMRRSEAERRGLKWLARLAGQAGHAQAPAQFATAPIGAVRKLVAKLDWDVDGVDLFEINEAFACVAMAAERDLGLPAEKVNVRGGACALGHPIGASGARVLVTLLYALAVTGGSRGIASLCIGGGEATAMAVEMNAGLGALLRHS